jgi:hypothetical protein
MRTGPASGKYVSSSFYFPFLFPLTVAQMKWPALPQKLQALLSVYLSPQPVHVVINPHSSSQYQRYQVL